MNPPAADLIFEMGTERGLPGRIDAASVSKERDAQRGGIKAYLMWSLAMVGYLFAMACRSSMSATGIQAAHHFHTTSTVLSSFVYLQLFVYAVMQIPAGLLLDRYGPRRLISAGCVLMSAGQTLLAFAPAAWMAVIGRAVVGSGDALIFISAIRLVAAWFPVRRLPLMNQLTGQLGSFGQLISIYPFVWLMNLTGWSAAFAAAGGIGMMIAVCVLLFLADRPGTARDDGRAAARHPAGIWPSIAVAARQRGTICGFWVHFTNVFSNSMMNSLWGVPFLLTVERYTRQQASAYLGAGIVMCAVWAVVFGRIAGIHPIHGRALIVYGSSGAQMILWAAVLTTSGPHPFWLTAALLAAVSSGWPAAGVAFDYVRDSNESGNLGLATGIANMGGSFSASIVMLGVGVLLDMQGASSPTLYTDHAMRVALLAQYPLWIVGLVGFALMLPATLAAVRRRYADISAGRWQD